MAPILRTRTLKRIVSAALLLVALLTVLGASRWDHDSHSSARVENAIPDLEEDAQDFEPDPELFVLLDAGPVDDGFRWSVAADEAHTLRPAGSTWLRSSWGRGPPAL